MQPYAGTASRSSLTYTDRGGDHTQSHHAEGVKRGLELNPTPLLTQLAYGVRQSQWGARKIGGRGWQIATP